MQLRTNRFKQQTISSDYVKVPVLSSSSSCSRLAAGCIIPAIPAPVGTRLRGTGRGCTARDGRRRTARHGTERHGTEPNDSGRDRTARGSRPPVATKRRVAVAVDSRGVANDGPTFRPCRRRRSETVTAAERRRDVGRAAGGRHGDRCCRDGDEVTVSLRSQPVRPTGERLLLLPPNYVRDNLRFNDITQRWLLLVMKIHCYPLLSIAIHCYLQLHSCPLLPAAAQCLPLLYDAISCRCCHPATRCYFSYPLPHTCTRC